MRDRPGLSLAHSVTRLVHCSLHSHRDLQRYHCTIHVAMGMVARSSFAEDSSSGRGLRRNTLQLLH